VLHTGRHYDDDLSDEALLYHYPLTGRPGGRDAADVAATKAAARLALPVFVILQTGSTRTVRKAWISAWDDEERLFLVEFAPAPVPRESPPTDDQPFVMFEEHDEVMRLVRGRPNQQRFKLQVLHRYGGQCALREVTAPELVQAAHLVPDSDRGSSDPRNGLPLCSNHRLALDRGLVAIDPPTRNIVVLGGHTARALGVLRSSLDHLPAQRGACVMPRRSTGAVVVRERRTGRVYALRFTAYGRREYLTLGGEAEAPLPPAKGGGDELAYGTSLNGGVVAT
jgi:hypothetical protein